MGANKPRVKQKTRKPPLGRRIGERARSLGLLGQDIVNDPRALPDKAHGLFRRWFQKVWNVRGGGLYACGFAITFVILEAREIVEDVAGFNNLGGIVSERILEFVIRFAVDSLINTMYAFMWPVYIVQLSPPYGAIALGIAFIVFPKYLKKPIERWLFADAAEHQ